MAHEPRLIFDVHLDLSYNALDFNRDLRWTQERIRRRELGMKDQVFRGRNTVCFPEMRRGRVGLCVATQIARSVDYFARMPGWMSPEQARAHTTGQLAWYREMEACGELVQIRNKAELEKQLALWLHAPAEMRATAAAGGLPIGYVLSLEGADSIVTFKHLEQSYAEGLRALGPVHYGPGIYGMGTDAEGPLTPRGRELLKEMDRLGIMLDATHLCDDSFREAMDLFQGRVWASHSNCRALVPNDRQFTDEQMKELIGRGAVIGGALDAWMMVPGWKKFETMPEDIGVTLEHLVDHIDHVCQLAGNALHAAIGGDTDGQGGIAGAPIDVDSVTDYQKLGPILANRGYAEEDIANVLYRNWQRFYEQHLPE